jgi:hypothetical protein
MEQGRGKHEEARRAVAALEAVGVGEACWSRLSSPSEARLSTVSTLRRRISSTSSSSCCAAFCSSRSMASTICGRETPRYGAIGALLVATARVRAR